MSPRSYSSQIGTSLLIGLVEAGGAVAVDRLRDNLLSAELVTIISVGKKVSAVGAIKSARPDYSMSISRKSG